MNTIKELEAIYSANIKKAQEELSRVKTRIYQISLLRVLLFLIGLVSVFFFFSKGWTVVLGLVACTFIPFLALMKYHNRLFYRKAYLLQAIEVNRRELAALDHQFDGFDGGSELIDSKHLYTYDLDVFGDHSLFQAINRTTTLFGKTALAQWLTAHLTTKQAIEERQAAVREWTPELDFRQHLQIVGLLSSSRPTDKAELTQWLSGNTRFNHKRWCRLLPYLTPLINLTLGLLALLGLLPWSALGLSFTLFFLLSTRFTSEVTKLQAAYGDKLRILSTYADMLAMLEQKSVESPCLKRLQEQVTSQKESASVAVRRLSRLMNRLDQRHNMLMYALLNGFLFWELGIVLKMETWKTAHADNMLIWLEAVGEMEALCSLATFAYNHPDYSYPIIRDTEFCFLGKALGHPLMPRVKCVRNDVDMGHSPSFVIITGANMAGKSTYLRTIGVNYLLGCLGVPVCADELELYPAHLITSLRTTDSLSDNESYFFAELKRLKWVIDKLHAGEELFIILDEILKGTNSMDKQKGSLALVKQLITLRANGIIATHDLLLGSLIDSFPEHIRNFCFEADIANDELTFSYQLREGIAQNMNACFLMKKMGIAVAE